MKLLELIHKLLTEVENHGNINVTFATDDTFYDIDDTIYVPQASNLEKERIEII